MTPERETQYFQLIERLLQCPNGQEPEILDAQIELVDAGFIRTLIQVASVMAHNDQAEGAKFLTHLARELAKQLGLYPDLSAASEGTP